MWGALEGTLNKTDALAAFILFVIVTLAFGLLMLVAPARVIRLQNWLGRADRWSNPSPNWKPKLAGWRLGGLFCLLMAAWMVWSFVTHPGAPRENLANAPRPTATPGWFGLGVAAVLIGGGLYFLARPETLVRWAARGRPDRIFTDQALRRGAVGARVFAAVMALFGLSALLMWLRIV